jgi:hypothetical protein
MKKVFFILTLFLCLFTFTIQFAGAENVCTVDDPTDTPLNVRATPWGKKIGTLPNGFEVDIIEVKYDKKGSAWAQVSGFYKGKHQIIGWVFQDYLACYPAEVEPQGPACTVADPTKTPLNVRNSPAGKKIGTIKNGTKVYIIDIYKDKKGKDWVKIGRYINQHYQEAGWVFKNYLNCP